MTNLNEIITGDNVEIMRGMQDGSIDLTVTSPPYDGLRTYNGYSFDFESVARELYRITRDGGVVVWVVGDATVKGSESGTSFRQVLFFMECGFNLHDTMVYAKRNALPSNIKSKRYTAVFEYMFILSKGAPKTFNAKEVPKLNQAAYGGDTIRTRTYGKEVVRPVKRRRDKPNKLATNIWEYQVGNNQTTKDSYAFKHPAMFPEKLADDHILSWSNPGDLVFDPFGGSGTTAKMALLNKREYIHIDVSDDYNDIARQRISDAMKTQVDGGEHVV